MCSLYNYSHPPLTAEQRFERGNQPLPSSPQSDPKVLISVKVTQLVEHMPISKAMDISSPKVQTSTTANTTSGHDSNRMVSSTFSELNAMLSPHNRGYYTSHKANKSKCEAVKQQDSSQKSQRNGLLQSSQQNQLQGSEMNQQQNLVKPQQPRSQPQSNNLKTDPYLSSNIKIVPDQSKKIRSSLVQAKDSTTPPSPQMLTDNITKPLHGIAQNINLQQQLTLTQQPAMLGQAVTKEQQAAACMRQDQLQATVANQQRKSSRYDISNLFNSQPVPSTQLNSLSPANSSSPTTTKQQPDQLARSPVIAQAHGLVSGLVSGKPTTSKVIFVSAKPKHCIRSVQFPPHLFKTQIDGDPGDSSDDSFTFANSDSDDSFTIAKSYADDDDEETAIEANYVHSLLPTVLYKKAPSPEKISCNLCLSPVACSLFCNKMCDTVVLSWSELDLEKIREPFTALKSLKLKNKLLEFLHYQKTAGLPVDGFFFNNHLLCLNSFCHITGISKYHASTVFKDFNKGYLRYIHGNMGKALSSARCVTFVCSMMRFIENYAQSGPTDVVQVIPSYLNKSVLFKIYLQEASSPHCKYSTFCKYFKGKFGPRREDRTLPWIRISKVSTHGKCDSCLGLDMYQRVCKSPAELEYCKALRKQHMNKYGSARVAVGQFIQRSISDPKQVLSLQIDSMDNSKSILPRVLEKSKGMTLMYRLPSKITGVIASSSLYSDNRKVKMFINHGIFMTITLIVLV